MKKAALLFVFLCVAPILFAKHQWSSENQNSSREKKERTVEDDWNQWKKDPHSMFDEDFSKKKKEKWDQSKDFSMEEGIVEEKFPEGKKIGPDRYERTLFKNKNHEITVRAEKDEKDGVSFSFKHEWDAD